MSLVGVIFDRRRIDFLKFRNEYVFAVFYFNTHNSNKVSWFFARRNLQGLWKQTVWLFDHSKIERKLQGALWHNIVCQEKRRHSRSNDLAASRTYWPFFLLGRSKIICQLAPSLKFVLGQLDLECRLFSWQTIVYSHFLIVLRIGLPFYRKVPGSFSWT